MLLSYPSRVFPSTAKKSSFFYSSRGPVSHSMLLNYSVLSFVFLSCTYLWLKVAISSNSRCRCFFLRQRFQKSRTLGTSGTKSIDCITVVLILLLVLAEMMKVWTYMSRSLFSSKWSSPKQIELQKWEYVTNFMRSSGPGGQSVNTTNSKAELRLKLDECSHVDENMLTNLKLKYSNNITKANQLVVRSQAHKSQGQNLNDCFERVQKILFECSQVKAERKQNTYVQPDENKEKRLASKKKKSEVKSTRQNKNLLY